MRLRPTGRVAALLWGLWLAAAVGAAPGFTVHDGIAVVEDDGTLIEGGHVFDLDGMSIAFTPNPSGGYDAEHIPRTFDSGWGERIEWDEPVNHIGTREMALTQHAFPFGGRAYDSLFVNTTGTVTFEHREDERFPVGRRPDYAAKMPAVAHILPAAGPVIAPLYNRFLAKDPSAIFAKELADRIVITWRMTSWFGSDHHFRRPNLNAFQATLFADGRIVFAYDRVDVEDAVLGIFPPPAKLPVEETISEQLDGAERELPRCIDIVRASLRRGDRRGVQVVYETRGAPPPPGDPDAQGLYYRFQARWRDPLPDGEWPLRKADFVIDIYTDGSDYIARQWSPQDPQFYGGGFTPTVDEDGVAITLPHSLLNSARRIAWRGSAGRGPVRDHFDGQLTRLRWARESRPVRLREDLPIRGRQPAIYEVFHHPVLKCQPLLRQFYGHFGDDYDFLIPLGVARIDTDWRSAIPFGWGRNTVEGIGQQVEDESVVRRYGSAGRLKGFIWPTCLPAPVYDRAGTDGAGAFTGHNRAKFYWTHEMSHRWLAWLKYDDRGDARRSVAARPGGALARWTPRALRIPHREPRRALAARRERVARERRRHVHAEQPGALRREWIQLVGPLRHGPGGPRRSARLLSARRRDAHR
ncbi:MAG TPA: hypothetical protein QGH10_01270 [Armatimonadota bacterium]|nr:hypothetical protein [Armatimonadota bacterium]